MKANKNGKVFVCADLHFSHTNIIKYEDRPFADREEMDEGLINNWNSVVTDADTVFVLGDVAFCGKDRAKYLVQRLNGKKILIMGNHDRAKPPAYWKEIGFDLVSPYPILLKEQYLLLHEPSEKEEHSWPDHEYFEIYGHVHDSPEYPDYTDCSACVSIERLNYRPALLEDVISGKAYSDRTYEGRSCDECESV